MQENWRENLGGEISVITEPSVFESVQRTQRELIHFDCILGAEQIGHSR